MYVNGLANANRHKWDHGYNTPSHHEAGENCPFLWFFSLFSSAIFCELAQGTPQRQVELRNLYLGWWFTKGNQQGPKKGHMECIHEDDCFPEMWDRAREKQG